MKTELRSPWLVAAWPGMGAVGRAALEFLLTQLGATPIAELDTREFFEVSSIRIASGLIQAPPERADTFYAWKHPGEGPDLLLLPGDRQPGSRPFQYCAELVRRAQELGAVRVVTFAALGTPIRPDASPRVLAVASSLAILAELRQHEVPLLQEGSIGGVNGIMLGAGLEHGLEGFCLLGEFPHFAQAIANPKASAAVLRVFARMTGIELDLSELDRSAQVLERNLIAHLRQLEAVATDAVENEATPVDPAAEVKQRIEALFLAAARDREKAIELKALLDRQGLFELYEDRFLDLFKQAG